MAPDCHEELAPLWLPLLEPSVQYAGDRMMMSEIIEGLANGTSQLWLIQKGEPPGTQVLGALVTRINTYRTALRALEVAILGGKALDLWGDWLADRMELVAKHFNCSRIEARGRPGWARRFRSRGYSHVETLFEKELE